MKYSAGELEATFAETLRRLAVVLDDASVPYMLIGGLAVGAWTEPRGTKDIDLAVALGDRGDVMETAFSNAGFAAAPRDWQNAASGGHVRLRTSGAVPLIVDLLCSGTEFETEALQRRRETILYGCKFFIAAPDDLIIYKLIAGRPQDFADIDRLLRSDEALFDSAHIERWAKAWEVEAAWSLARTTARR